MTKEQTPPLVSDAQITWRSMCAENGVIVEETSFNVGAYFIRDIYEADRQKTREVVQALVDAIVDNAKYRLLTEGEEGDTLSDFMNLTLNAAIALAKSQMNIEPTKP